MGQARARQGSRYQYYSSYYWSLPLRCYVAQGTAVWVHRVPPENETPHIDQAWPYLNVLRGTSYLRTHAQTAARYCTHKVLYRGVPIIQHISGHPRGFTDGGGGGTRDVAIDHLPRVPTTTPERVTRRPKVAQGRISQGLTPPAPKKKCRQRSSPPATSMPN